MHQLLILAIKALAGGSLVVAFALLSEGLSPKRFAGLLSAAPAVALASLAVVLLDRGHHAAHENSLGMVAGSVGMVAYAAAAIPLLRRVRASAAAALALGGWLVIASAAAVPIVLA